MMPRFVADHLLWMRLVISLTVAIIALSFVSEQAVAQFQSGIALVEIEVSVSGRNGAPITGLSTNDFTVFESGQPRKIYRVLEFGNPTTDSRLSGPPLERLEQLPEHRLAVILLDDAGIKPDPGVVARVKNIGRAIAESLDSSDRLAIVFTGNTRASVDLTNNRPHLLQALNNFRARYPSTRLGPMARKDVTDDHDARTTLSTLEAVIKYLGTVAGRRKSIFYVSMGVPLPRQDIRSFSRIMSLMQPVFVAAKRAHVSIYTIDPGGQGSSSIADSGQFGSGRMRGLQPRHEFLQVLAENTGGHSVVESNNPDNAVKGFALAHKNYYLVWYEAADRYTKLSDDVMVNVSIPDATVRFRLNAPYEQR